MLSPWRSGRSAGGSLAAAIRRRPRRRTRGGPHRGGSSSWSSSLPSRIEEGPVRPAVAVHDDEVRLREDAALELVQDAGGGSRGAQAVDEYRGRSIHTLYLETSEC